MGVAWTLLCSMRGGYAGSGIFEAGKVSMTATSWGFARCEQDARRCDAPCGRRRAWWRVGGGGIVCVVVAVAAAVARAGTAAATGARGSGGGGGAFCDEPCSPHSAAAHPVRMAKRESLERAEHVTLDARRIQQDRFVLRRTRTRRLSIQCVSRHLGTWSDSAAATSRHGHDQ
eukprot:953403-Pleurochrysis_carterae.AAC.6